MWLACAYTLGYPTHCFRIRCCRRLGYLACMVIAQVADLAYLAIDGDEDPQQDDILAAESLVTALCYCPLLQALTLDSVYLRCACFLV
jgi:hypothetical protein